MDRDAAVVPEAPAALELTSEADLLRENPSGKRPGKTGLLAQKLPDSHVTIHVKQANKRKK